MGRNAQWRREKKRQNKLDARWVPPTAEEIAERDRRTHELMVAIDAELVRFSQALRGAFLRGGLSRREAAPEVVVSENPEERPFSQNGVAGSTEM